MLNFIYRFRFVFIGVAVVSAASITTLDLTRGNITESYDFAASYTYGESITYTEGKAFMGDVTYEFRRIGDQTWSEETPRDVGMYEARARSTGSHGYKYSNVSKFEIKPFETTFDLASTNIDFGNDHPEFVYKLLNGDHLEKDQVIVNYEDLTARTTFASIQKDSIKVTDSKGNDVTSCYSFIVKDKEEITFNKAPLSVTFREKGTLPYTGEEIRSDEFDITKGSLYYGAHVEYKGGISAIEGGNKDRASKTYDNNHSVVVVSQDGATDYTNNYDITLKDNHIVIGKAPSVTISSQPLEKTYDGHTFSQFDNPEQLITINGTFLKGHHFKLIDFVNKDVYQSTQGTDIKKNTFTYEIVDDNGDPISSDELELYQSITPVYGNFEIKQKDITITSLPITATFDNRYHSLPDYEKPVAGLADTDEIIPTVEECTKQLAPTSSTGVPNVLKYKIMHGAVDVTNSYNVTPVWKNIVINKQPLKFTFTNQHVDYDGNSHPYYYADGNYAVYDTVEKRENAALIDESVNSLPAGWTYDVRIPSSFKMRNYSATGYKPNISDIEVHIYDDSEPAIDVSSYYNIGTDITFDIPASTIIRKKLDVTVSDYEKTYNNRSIAEDIVINPNDSGTKVVYSGLVSGDLPDVTFSGNNQNNTNANDNPYVLSLNYGVKDTYGNDLTSNYYPINFYNDKTTINAKIDRKDIVIAPNDVSKVYDGTNQFKPAEPYIINDAAINPNLNGETVYLKSQLTNPNFYSTASANVNDPVDPYKYDLNVDDVIIKDANNIDVTSNYNIFVQGKGNVNITKRTIYIDSVEGKTSYGSYIVCDGDTHGVYTDANDNPSPEISVQKATSTSQEGLINGHKLRINNAQALALGYLEVGPAADLDVEIYDSNDFEVTQNYNIYHSAFYIDVVKTRIIIEPYYQEKVYDGAIFDVEAFEGIGFGDYSNYNTNLMKQLYSVSIETYDHNGDQIAALSGKLQSGHMLQLTKYSQSCASTAIDAEHYYPFQYEYKIVNSNTGTPIPNYNTIYEIEAPQTYTNLYVHKASIRINCNSDGRLYNGEECQPPVSGQFTLTTSKNEPAYISSANTSLGDKFYDRYEVRGQFVPSSTNPSPLYIAGTYEFSISVTIIDSQNGSFAFNNSFITKNIEVTFNNPFDEYQPSSYIYTIEKNAIRINTTKPTSSGKVLRSYSGYLAPGDKIYFGPNKAEEMTNTRKVYTYDISDYHIYRGDFEVTNLCYKPM